MSITQSLGNRAFSDSLLVNIISVGATDQNDNQASFSNYGVVNVDIGAPGTNIYSARPGRQTVWSDNFDDNGAGDWTTGGTSSWQLTGNTYYSPQYSPLRTASLEPMKTIANPGQKLLPLTYLPMATQSLSLNLWGNLKRVMIFGSSD